MQQQLARDVAALRTEIAQSKAASNGDTDAGWIDAKRAAKYLGLSATTFDKYRYQTHVKIKGYKVGGKLLYQRKDLDSFVKLFEINSAL